jgi:hypothetical protein
MTSHFDAQQVHERIFLGSEDAAHASLCELQKRNIVAIVVCGFGISMIHGSNVQYMKIPAIDLPVYDIIQHIQQVYDFIQPILNQNETNKVLIHCARGKSRSASIAIGYLMLSEKISFAEAHHRVKQARSIGLNFGFTEQLRLFEAMGCSLTGTTKAHETYTNKYKKKKKVSTQQAQRDERTH